MLCVVVFSQSSFLEVSKGLAILRILRSTIMHTSCVMIAQVNIHHFSRSFCSSGHRLIWLGGM